MKTISFRDTGSLHMTFVEGAEVLVMEETSPENIAAFTKEGELVSLDMSRTASEKPDLEQLLYEGFEVDILAIREREPAG